MHDDVKPETFHPLFSDFRPLETLQGSQWEQLQNDFMCGSRQDREVASKIIIGTLEPSMFNSLKNLNLRISTDISDMYQKMLLEILYRVPTMNPYGEPYGYFKKFFDGIVMDYNRNGQSVYQIKHYGRITQISHSFTDDGSLDNDQQGEEGKLAQEINAATTCSNFEEKVIDNIMINQLKKKLGQEKFTELLTYVTTDEGYKRLSTLFSIINRGEKIEKKAAYSWH